MSQAQRLRQTIEDEIVAGRLAVGARLDEVMLAERFGVSRTPIREALLQLAVTGLVETKPRKGTIVSAPEPQHLLAMFETMAELEAACGRFAARRLTPDHEAALKAALAAGVAIALGHDWNPFYNSAIELERLVHHGMPSAAALVAATATGAAALGLAGEVGTVEPGRIADLLVVDGDPLADPGLLRRRERIWLVIQLGEPVAGAALERSWTDA